MNQNIIDDAMAAATVDRVTNRFRATHNHFGLLNHGFGDSPEDALADLRAGLMYQNRHNGTPF